MFTGIFIRFAGNLSGYLEYLIAAIVVGFIVGESLINGIINGLMASLIGGVIAFFINLTFMGNIEISGFIFVLFISIFLMVLMGFIGGIIGYYLFRYSKILTKKPDNISSYLQCKSCGGYYILEPGELPGDFVGCSCGGELEERKKLSDFKQSHTKEERPHSKNSSKLHPFLKIIIIIVLGSLIFSYVLSPLFYLILLGLDYFGPSAGNYLFILFFGGCLAAILGLIWYGFKKK